LVEDVEQSNAELELLRARHAEVLEQRQIVIDARRHAQVVRRDERPVFAERRNLDAVDVEDLFADAGVPRPRIARVNGREPTPVATARSGIADDVRRSEDRLRYAVSGRLTTEPEEDRDTASQALRFRTTATRSAKPRPIGLFIAPFAASEGRRSMTG